MEFTKRSNRAKLTKAQLRGRHFKDIFAGGGMGAEKSEGITEQEMPVARTGIPKDENITNMEMPGGELELNHQRNMVPLIERGFRKFRNGLL